MRKGVLLIILSAILSSCANSIYKSSQVYIPLQDSSKLTLAANIGFSGYQIAAAAPVFKSLFLFGNFLSINNKGESFNNLISNTIRYKYHESIDLGFGINPRYYYQGKRKISLSLVAGLGQGFGAIATTSYLGPGSSHQYQYSKQTAEYQKIFIQPNLTVKPIWGKFHYHFALRMNYLWLNKYYGETYYYRYEDFKSLQYRNIQQWLIEPVAMIEYKPDPFFSFYMQSIVKIFTRGSENFIFVPYNNPIPISFIIGIRVNPVPLIKYYTAR